MTTLVDRRPAPLVTAVGVGASIGLVIGVATALLQGVLDVPWAALANAASPWLAGAFVAGAIVRRPGLAALAGGITCVGEVTGYYLAAAVRGDAASSSAVLFWIACGLLGGPALAELGRLWSRGGAGVRLLAAAALASCFLLEAVRYAVVLHYGSRAALFAAVAAVVLVLGVLVRPPEGDPPTR